MMIAIDTSALIAIILQESDWREYVNRMGAAQTVYVSAVTLTETLIVTRVKRGSRARNLVSHTMQLSRFEVVPVDASMAKLAYDAFEIYGKGSGHPAQLNFGDTFSYALARIKKVPLLFKGDDFAQTDLQSAMVGS